MLLNIRRSVTLRSGERLSSFNKNNRDNRSGEIKLNTGFRGAYFSIRRIIVFLVLESIGLFLFIRRIKIAAF